LQISEENPKVVAEMFGNSTVILTLDTSIHILPSNQSPVTEKLEEILFILFLSF
jgi:hypothetical protein